MKYLLTIFLLTFGSVFKGDVSFSVFNAAPVEENKILIEWVTTEEVNVKEYYVQRSYQKDINFAAVSKAIKAQGPSSYRYKDTVALKGEDKSRVYYYRLKIVKHDNTFSYSQVVDAIAHVSSARQTWGKLKAMFH